MTDYQPGQYVKVEGTPLSLANLHKNQLELEFVIRVKNNQDVLRNLLGKINKKEPLQVTGPFGESILQNHNASSKHTIFLSGGTGFSQIGPLVQQWLHQHPEHPATVYCGLPALED